MQGSTRYIKINSTQIQLTEGKNTMPRSWKKFILYMPVDSTTQYPNKWSLILVHRAENRKQFKIIVIQKNQFD
jgi:hypothetical protein